MALPNLIRQTEDFQNDEHSYQSHEHTTRLVRWLSVLAGRTNDEIIEKFDELNEFIAEDRFDVNFGALDDYHKILEINRVKNHYQKGMEELFNQERTFHQNLYVFLTENETELKAKVQTEVYQSLSKDNLILDIQDHVAQWNDPMSTQSEKRRIHNSLVTLENLIVNKYNLKEELATWADSPYAILDRS